jgi:hypothetical protein
MPVYLQWETGTICLHVEIGTFTWRVHIFNAPLIAKSEENDPLKKACHRLCVNLYRDASPDVVIRFVKFETGPESEIPDYFGDLAVSQKQFSTFSLHREISW